MLRRKTALTAVVLVIALLLTSQPGLGAGVEDGAPQASELKAGGADITVYYALMTALNNYLFPVQVRIPSASLIPKAAMEKLLEGPPEGSSVSPIPFPDGTDLLGVEVRDGTAYVNLNERASRAGVGSSGDLMLVGSIVNTLCACTGVRKVQILVEGKIHEAVWGHVDTSRPLDPMDNLLFKGFADARGHWAERDLLGLAIAGIFEGYPDGTVHPDRHISRAEFVTILLKAREIQPSSTARQTFSDVPRSHWSHDVVESAIDAGLLRTADYNGRLKPDEPVQRAEAAMILVRAAGLEERAAGLKASTLPFRDIAQLPGWARGYISAASEAGLIKGYPDGSFRPGRNVTRAEAAAVAMRMIASATERLVVMYPRSGARVKGDLLVVGLARGAGSVSLRLFGGSGSQLSAVESVTHKGASEWRTFAVVMPCAELTPGSPISLDVRTVGGTGGTSAGVRIPLRAG